MSFLKSSWGRSGFSFLELCFAVALFSTFAVGSIFAINLFNRQASASRYQTLALSVAQQRIDQLMHAPCVTGTTATSPPILTLGSTTYSPAISGTTTILENTANYYLNNDPLNTGTLTGSQFSTRDLAILDSRTTLIESLTNREMRFTVTVRYSFRGSRYPISITMYSLRATDNF